MGRAERIYNFFREKRHAEDWLLEEFMRIDAPGILHEGPFISYCEDDDAVPYMASYAFERLPTPELTNNPPYFWLGREA